MPVSNAHDLSGKYELRQQIGKGSFGAAFLVLNKEDKNEYVLKRVRLSKQTKWQRNSTLQERELVSKQLQPCLRVTGNDQQKLHDVC
jgi:serine/threonine protein kinase